MKRLLLAHSASLIGGGNKVLLSLLDGLNRDRFAPVSVIPERGPLEDELRKRDVPYFVLDLRPQPGGRGRSALKVARLIVKILGYRIDLLHANDSGVYRLLSVAAGITRRPIVCHFHHPNSNGVNLSWSFRRRPDVVVTPSYHVKRFVECRVDDGIRVETIWNPIDTDWFRPTNDQGGVWIRLGFPTGMNHVSIVGALQPHKGHECFLRMAAKVLEQLPNTQFHVVGSEKTGSEKYSQRLRRLCEEVGISTNVRFWGFVPDELAREIIQASNLFVLPTREEGFGLSVAEAQACEVPVLSSSIAPLDEVVSDGRSGHLIEPSDHHCFASHAIEILRSRNLQSRMGRAGRDWVTDRFSRDMFSQSFDSLYDQILNNSTEQSRVKCL